jgi:hypothetical protein
MFGCSGKWGSGEGMKLLEKVNQTKKWKYSFDSKVLKKNIEERNIRK